MTARVRGVMKKSVKFLIYSLGIVLSLGIIILLVYQGKDSIVKIWEEVQTKYLFLSLLSSALIYVRQRVCPARTPA